MNLYFLSCVFLVFANICWLVEAMLMNGIRTILLTSLPDSEETVAEVRRFAILFMRLKWLFWVTAALVLLKAATQ